MKATVFEALEGALKTQSACAVVTYTETGEQSIIVGENKTGDLVLADDHLAEIERMVANDSSGPLGETSLFVRVYGPAPRMIIVGAVHIAQALAPMAHMAGFDVSIIDPRESFVRAGRIADVAVLTDWPDEGMAKLKPDSRTAVVTLTHDPKLDDPALAAALRSQAFYIGSLGSKRTHEKRLERLKSEGFSDEELMRIHGPVGLNIKAKAPSEIAVAILGEVIETRRTLAA